MSRHASVFVVEDEALIAMELRDRLTALSYTVCGSAARGEQALEEIPIARPDVVLMDVHLAGELNGIQTGEQLRKQSDVPIVFLTAFSDEELLRQAGEVGAIGYLVKPFQERELHATLQTALFKHQMELQLRQALAALDAMDDAAFVFEPETFRFSYVNQGAARQLGHSRATLLTMTALEVMPEFDAPKLKAILLSMCRGEERVRRLCTLHRHRNGQDVPVEVNLQCIAPAGECARFIAVARDITERLALERLVLRTQRLEAIGTLAGGVAHELNNALTPLVLGLASLRNRSPQESGILNVVEASANRCAHTVRQLLTFSKGEVGERAAVQPCALLQELETKIQGWLPKNIELTIRMGPALDSVNGDAKQLLQVLLNLITNAKEAMPQGGTLAIEAKQLDFNTEDPAFAPEAKAGRYVSISVKDSGAGIPAEILDRIFDPFFTTKDLERGTGLGLSSALGIVKGHGGFLRASSSPGNGALFTVYLPISE